MFKEVCELLGIFGYILKILFKFMLFALLLVSPAFIYIFLIDRYGELNTISIMMVFSFSVLLMAVYGLISIWLNTNLTTAQKWRRSFGIYDEPPNISSTIKKNSVHFDQPEVKKPMKSVDYEVDSNGVKYIRVK
ncbi:hypothetical protein EV693_10384 [Nicoletella semolina]|uniref:Uncharacterized protein n=1 Tax=Nicoletella semolina TaxID=271160 RepID=A0A4R2NAS3_9PAST|nr:hypothetical protein [Nicoletella semolina]MDH2923984.1 hypothetical protein [Nicoletella semolina]TCP18118.1 hypothetical protein EV693_10384 [Nicoletella semolina]